MKSANYQRLLAIDPSLTSTGWALFVLREQKPSAVGLLVPPGPRMSLAERFDALQAMVESLFSEFTFGASDILLCEGPAPLVLNPQSALKVEGVRGIFEAVARSRGMLVPGRLNPRTIQGELLGMRGRQLDRKQVKSWAREVAKRLYGAQLRKLTNKEYRHVPQDIIDASLIGSLAVSRVQLAIRYGADLQSAFLPRYKTNRRGSGGKSSSRRWAAWSETEYRQLIAK